LPEAIKLYVKYVELVRRSVGINAMYIIFAMFGVLVFSSTLWPPEVFQTSMMAFVLLCSSISQLRTSTFVWLRPVTTVETNRG